MNAAREEFDEQGTYQEAWLSAYLDDELTAEQREAVEQRLAADPSVRQTLADLERVRGLVQQLPAWMAGPIEVQFAAESFALAVEEPEAEKRAEATFLEVEPLERSAHPPSDVLKEELSGESSSRRARRVGGLWWGKPLAAAASLLVAVGIVYSLWQAPSTTEMAGSPQRTDEDVDFDARPGQATAEPLSAFAEGQSERLREGLTGQSAPPSNEAINPPGADDLQDGVAETQPELMQRTESLPAPYYGQAEEEPPSSSARSMREEPRPEVDGLAPEQLRMGEDAALKSQLGATVELEPSSAPPPDAAQATNGAAPRESMSQRLGRFDESAPRPTLRIGRGGGWSEEEAAQVMPEITAILQVDPSSQPTGAAGRASTRIANQFPLFFARFRPGTQADSLAVILEESSHLKTITGESLGSIASPSSSPSLSDDSLALESDFADTGRTPTSQSESEKRQNAVASGEQHVVLFLQRSEAEAFLEKLGGRAADNLNWFRVSGETTEAQASPEQKVIVLLRTVLLLSEPKR